MKYRDKERKTEEQAQQYRLGKKETKKQRKVREQKDEDKNKGKKT
jgi:hypothetical protein